MGEMPSRKEKYLAWIMMALISFFFAEIVSGNWMFKSLEPGAIAFNLIWALVVSIPLYGLHTLVLAWAVYRFGRPRLYTLFFAGVIFALYEAYVTKVLWVGWGPDTKWFIGGVAVVETVILLLFWHPFMAFVVPLFASESLLTRSREVLSGLPGPLRRLFSARKSTYVALMLFALLCGIFPLGGIASPACAIASELLAFVVFGILLYVYRHKGLHRYDIRQLLPTRRELVVLVAWLLLVYVVFGLGIRPETLRNLLPQAIVWGLYAFFLLMLYLSLKKSKGVAPPAREFPIRLSWRLYGAFFLLMTATAALIGLVPFRVVFSLIAMLAGVCFGAVVLALSVRDAISR